MSQQIIGSSHQIPQAAVLDCDPKLVGDSLSIHLSQQAGNAAGTANSAVWALDVYVQIAQGWYHLGHVDTVPPSLGTVPARTVAIATCPGATGWRVECACTTDDEIADIALQSSACCSASIGVTSLEPGGGGTDQDVVVVGPPSLIDPWSNTFSTALSNSFIIRAAPGTIRNLTFRLDSTLASGTYYLQVWDLAAPPVDGTAVTLVNSLDAPLKIVHVLGVDDLIVKDWSELGVDFDVGASLNISSTEFTKTTVAGAFGSVIGAEYRP